MEQPSFLFFHAMHFVWLRATRACNVLHKASKCLGLEAAEVPWALSLMPQGTKLVVGTAEPRGWGVHSGQNPWAPIPCRREALGFPTILLITAASAAPEQSVRGSGTTGQHSQPCGRTRVQYFHGQSMQIGSGP